MQKNLAVTSSPHLRDNISTRRIMQEVCLALAPAGIAGIVLYGSNAAMLIAVAVFTAVAAEWAWQKLNHQPSSIGDWSAAVTGLLLAYNLPANAPLWLAVVGSLIAIILVKQMFGGIGSNFMNPALAIFGDLWCWLHVCRSLYIREGMLHLAIPAAWPEQPPSASAGGRRLSQLRRRAHKKILPRRGRWHGESRDG